jgi:ferredoxin
MKILELTCRQCDECFRVCPINAIIKTPSSIYPRHNYKINEKLCNNCGKCIDKCKYKCIIWSSRKK